MEPRARPPRRVHAEPQRGRENHGRLQGRRRSSGRQASCGAGGDTGGRRSRGDRTDRRRRRRTTDAAPGIRPAGPGGRGSRLPQGRVRPPAGPRRRRGARPSRPESTRGATGRYLRARRPPRRTLLHRRDASGRARETLEEYRGAHERARGASSARPRSERPRTPESFPRACSKPKGAWIAQISPRRPAASAKPAPCCRKPPTSPGNHAGPRAG